MPEAPPIRVLLADDDPATLALLQSYLQDAEYEILVARNGREALAMVQEKGPEIVLTDWSMPELDGLQVCRAIRSREGMSFVYLILVTAHGEEEDAVAAFEAGADDYVRKPFRRKELLARVRAGARIVRLQQQLETQALEASRRNAEMAISQEKLERAYQQLNVVAATDALTGLTNRREALARLEEYWALAARQGHALACIAIDIDHFKSFNDVYGHSVGDAVLRHVADVLQKAVRRGETLARVGGEEFLVICPGACEDTALVAAERLRVAVEASRLFLDGRSFHVTVSIGVAGRTPDLPSPDHLLRAADKALYAAKDAGRNASRAARSLEDTGKLDAGPAELLDGASVPSRGPEEGVRVLVAEADASVRLFCRRLLLREGYDVVEAVDVQDAVRKTTLERPDAIVIDAVLSGGGLECAARLKADPATRDIPVIVTRSRTDGIDTATILAAGADDFLTKPLQPQEFALRVRNMVRFNRELVRSNSVRGEQTRALDLFLTFSRDIAAAASMKEILETTLVTAASLLCSRRVCVLMPDAEEQHLTVAIQLGLHEEHAASLRIPVGQGVAGRVFAQRRGVVLTGHGSEVRSEAPDYELFPGTPSICAPLLAPEGIVGVLTVSGRREANPFGPLETEYADLICNLAASAIQDCRSRRARDEARDSIVVTLARLAESRDLDTGKHLDRVTQFCILLAEELRRRDPYREVITDDFLSDLTRAVPLHDIGKVAIPDHILQKPGRLTPEEMAIMRTHAGIGARTIRSMIDRAPGARFLEMAEQIALGHHEWFDGSGYPAGRKGDSIPLPARIVALADVYDALTTRRVYKQPIPHDEAVATIVASSGRQFDPDVVDAFRNCNNSFAELARRLTDEPVRPGQPARLTRSLRPSAAAT